MAITEKGIMGRLYLVVGVLFLFALGVVVRLMEIQLASEEEKEEWVQNRVEDIFPIPAKRGNLYSEDGSLLAVSVVKYKIFFDPVTVDEELFNENIVALSDSLSQLLNKPSSDYVQMFRVARDNRNMYKHVASGVSHLDFLKMKAFPIFKEGRYGGGFQYESYVVRDYPLDTMARRTIGYDKIAGDGEFKRIGLDGAFSEYLKGIEGKRLKQKIANGQWKPVGYGNLVEPKDGNDLVTTIDVNIQDVAHHELLTQLKKFDAHHGCVIVMEVETGEIKAITNLEKTDKGVYDEEFNYAIGEAHEPGSTFKLMSLMAALEDKAIDTSDVVDTGDGWWTLHGFTIRDSNSKHGNLKVSEAFAVSSNVAFAKMIHQQYRSKPKQFVDRLRNMGLHEKIGLRIRGEGTPIMHYPDDRKNWSGSSLTSMSYGYGVTLTPLQTLAFYNAVANNGNMVKPRFIKELRQGEKVVKRFKKEPMGRICTNETVGKVQKLLRDVVEKGTGKKLYDPKFSMAGKTGTCWKNYGKSGGAEKDYISSFVGYFPADKPKYSCIVVIHEPVKNVGYYGADVAGPIFKSLAHKIYATSPYTDRVSLKDPKHFALESSYQAYFKKAQQQHRSIPNVKGMCGMDAVALLENMGLTVEVVGNGKVVKQSVAKGTRVTKVGKIVLELS